MARDPQITHKIMSSVKSKDTRPEIALCKALWSMGLRYRINYKKLPGKPDIVFTKAKIAVFCDGYYWHGHNWAVRGLKSLDEELSHYSEFWSNKIRGNISRDETVNNELKNMGWHVIRIWESDIKIDVTKCASQINQVYISRIKCENLDKLLAAVLPVKRTADYNAYMGG